MLIRRELTKKSIFFEKSLTSGLVTSGLPVRDLQIFYIYLSNYRTIFEGGGAEMIAGVLFVIETAYFLM